MKKIIAYLMFLLAILVTIWVLGIQGRLPSWVNELGVVFHCILIGGIGGSLYCLRAVYLNVCVRKSWDTDWHVWYYVRPVVSLITGGISWLFLKAGLLILDASLQEQSSDLGFLALAFIAGYNVDKFMVKLEQISEASWGIDKSRASKIKEDD